jgi:ubiquitin C-terminal hydrolase
MKRLQIARPPQALCLHLRRLLMDHRGELMKTDAEVTFPLKLDLAPFCLFRQGSVEKLLYDLAAVVVHHGNAMGGHFTVFRRVSRTEITNPNLYGRYGLLPVVSVSLVLSSLSVLAISRMF